jgi:uncharacterized membrane protein YcfT
MTDRRIMWIDIARGISMMLVVSMHFDEMFFRHLASYAPAAAVWDALSSAARPARIPAFFLLSGILASEAIKRPFHATFSRRVLVQYYLFVVWSIIHIATLFILYREFSGRVIWDFFAYNLSNMIWPTTQIWFLFGLAVFFIGARLCRDHPRSIIAAALVGSCFSEFLDDVVASLMLRSFVFYLIGCYFPLLVQTLAVRIRSITLVVLALAYAGAVALILIVGENVAGIWLPASFLGVALLFGAAVWMQNSSIGLLLAFVGKRTLPIYVIHGMLLLIAGRLVKGLEFDHASGFWIAAQFAAPLIGISTLVAACLAAYYVLKRMHANWLFSLPATLDHRISMSLKRFAGAGARM